MKMSKRFFVYDLIDPRCGSVFYVGKGQKNRPYEHEREAIKGKQSDKCDKIREILASGNKVCVKIVERFADETEAYKFEFDRIQSIGLDNLTNICSGSPSGVMSGDDRPTFSNATADILARAIKYIADGNRIRLWSYDVTDGIALAVKAYIDALGEDHVMKKLSDRGVRINYVATI